MWRNTFPLTTKLSYTHRYTRRYQYNNAQKRIYKNENKRTDNLSKKYGKIRKEEKQLSGRRPSSSDLPNPDMLQYLLQLRLLARKRSWADANRLLKEAISKGEKKMFFFLFSFVHFVVVFFKI